ncbi:angiopoietin-related protein 6-like [Drosophila serrata]|uniref:angiopoietin-related protein 6-like n=1 Tax=Drosophila serrata TaxID=7274 RepID=UPI000A1D31D3|nr:angiopoietin-related protein 6-like [Drosophila serrata]XP_020799433.1 angiopoietin-related protein 6-like [Drosophila serrata]
MIARRVLIGIILVVFLAQGSIASHRSPRGVHVKLPGSNSVALTSAVRSVKEKIEQQNEILSRLANATEQPLVASNAFLRNCALTDKHGYTRIQLEEASKPFDVFCEQAQDEGGWTLVLQRFNGTRRTAQEFRTGYNSIVDGEYFLGTDKLYALTHSRDHELLFVMEFMDRTTRTHQAQRFILQSPTAHLTWAEEQETARYSWAQWEQEIARLPAGKSWESYESCPGRLCGLERFIVFLLKWNFAQLNHSPLIGRPNIRLFKLLLRPSNSYWTVQNS